MTGTSAGSAGKFAGRRHKQSRLGVALAVVALLSQIAGSGLHVRAPIAAVNVVDKLFIDFGAHALCLARDITAPGSPASADKAPKADHDFAACCVGHVAAGAVLAPARSSSESCSLHLVSRTRHRRRTFQLVLPAPFAPARLRQELNALAA